MNMLFERLMGQLGDNVSSLQGFFPLEVPLVGVPRELFYEVARTMKFAGARLVAEWAADETLLDGCFGIYACYNADTDFLVVKCVLPADDPQFQSLTKKYVAAYRFERQMHSLMGVIPAGNPDSRPWIKHEDWPEDAWPLRKTFDSSTRMHRVDGNYRWVSVQGEGPYEIPVGPVHAGIIEPGHFRFQAMGEDVLNLEERLGYVHKGIEKRFEELSWEEGVRLAGRVSGDTTVAHALAYCRALEAMTGCQLPERAHWLRGIMLEQERIANHLGDIGAICNDVAFTFLYYQCMTLKERLLRTNGTHFGHRYLKDRIVPGGVVVDLDDDGINSMLREHEEVSGVFERLVKIYDNSPSLEDRVRQTGVLRPERAAELGTVGIVARASGQRLDSREQWPIAPYDMIVPKISVHQSGDVNARVWVRIDEIRESFRLLREMLTDLPLGEISRPCAQPVANRSALAIVEGWRGEIVYWLQSGTKGEISRCMVRDPSSLNWLGLEQAIPGNIVPDFPVCNKSFNQSYSGHDL